jgi:hypothetical protein
LGHKTSSEEVLLADKRRLEEALSSAEKALNKVERNYKESMRDLEELRTEKVKIETEFYGL